MASPALGKHGKFNLETLTVQFGGPLSKPHNIFTAKAIKVPKYSYTKSTRECLGGGWYGSGRDITNHIVDNEYAIFKDDVFIGTMRNSERESHCKLDTYTKIPQRIQKIIDELKTLV